MKMIYTLALDQKWRTFIPNLNRDVLLSRRTQNTSINILLCPWNISDLGPEPDPGPRNPSPLTPYPKTPEPPWPLIILMGTGDFPSLWDQHELSMFRTKISSKTCTSSKQKVRIVTPVGIELSISHLIISVKVPKFERKSRRGFNGEKFKSFSTSGGFDLKP